MKVETQTIKGGAKAILETSQALNATFAQRQVDFAYRTHYANTRNGDCGVEDLICRILSDAGAVFPAMIGETEFRPLAVTRSLFVKEIDERVRQHFGDDRYPLSTVAAYCSTLSKRIGKVKLTNTEDFGRPREACKPRRKYFLLQ